jgi:hypothetical protein
MEKCVGTIMQKEDKGNIKKKMTWQAQMRRILQVDTTSLAT